MAGKRATIKDVAALAKVSISTVSRSLSGNVFVEEETKQRVLAAVKELNYEPNMVAKGLKAQKSNTIALILPGLNSLYYSSIMDGVESVADQKGCSVFINNSHGDMEKEKEILNNLGMRAVDGIVCMSVRNEYEHIYEIQKKYGMKMVFLNRDPMYEVPSIGIDMEHGAYILTDYLISRGHKKIAAVFSTADKLRRNRQRYEGYSKALWKRGVEERSEFILEDMNSTGEVFEKMKEVLSREDRPTAVFAAEEVMVLGVYQAAHYMGIKIPEELSVVCFDEAVTSAYYSPALTTYDSKAREIAEKGTEMLFDEMEGKPMPFGKITVQGKVIERDSVRDITKE